jgi:hypothetical protein
MIDAALVRIAALYSSRGWAQDSFDDGAIVDQTDELHGETAAGTAQGIGFVDLLDQPRPGAFLTLGEVILSIGGGSLPGR